MNVLPSLQKARQRQASLTTPLNIIGGLIIALGVAGLLGILLDIQLLRSILPYDQNEVLLAMPSAISLIFLGVAIISILGTSTWSKLPLWVWPVRLVSLIAMGSIGIYLFSSYLFLSDFNIIVAITMRHPALMTAFQTSLSLCLLTFALVVFLLNRHSEPAIVYGVNMPALVVLYMALTALGGHLGDVPILYSYEMSVPAALGLMLASVAIFIGTLPFSGLMLPLFSQNVKNRAMTASILAISLTILVLGIFVISKIDAIIFGPKPMPGVITSLQQLYAAAELSLILLVTAFNMVSIRALNLMNRSAFFTQQMQHGLQREATLRHLLQAIYSTLDLEEVFHRLVNEIGPVLRADRCFITRYNQKTGRLVPPTQEYRADPALPSMIGVMQRFAGESAWLLEEMCQAGHPVNFEPDMPHLSEDTRKFMAEGNIQSGLGCAVLHRNRCLAILFIHTIRGKRQWTQDEKDLIQTAANQAALALYQAELFRSLQETEERYRLMIEGAEDHAIYMMDTQGFITSWNVGAEKVKGYKADEIAGKHFSCFYTDEDIDKGLPHQVLQATLEHGQHEEEGWRMRKDGSHIWANTVTHALRNDRGDVVGMFRITRDITGRKMAEDALASQAHRQSTTSTLTLSALTGIDIDTLMNQSVSLLAQTLNVPFATVLELLPDGSEMLLKAGVGWPPGYVGTITITADQNSQAGYTLVVEEPVVVDDLRRETRFSPSPFLLNNGIISGISVIIQGREKPYGVLGVHSNQYRRFSEEDVNFLQSVANILGIALERKRIEIELEEAKEGAQEASQKKSQFLANMSHELRTPLNSIIGYGEMLEGGYAGQMNDRQQRYIHNMVVSGHRLLNMVNDILDLSQSETGEITLNTRTFHVMPFMDEVKEQMQPMADSKKVYLAFHIQPELEVIEADPVRLRQIMLNLISNAIKFNHEGGEVNVRMGTSPDEEWIECEVIDTGIGIPREKIDSMFQEFYQVDASIARREEGTGLGLAITRRLVELHGGSIQVESIEGQGSTFSFRIPAFAHARIQKDIREQAS